MKCKKVLRLLSIAVSLFLLLGTITYGGRAEANGNASPSGKNLINLASGAVKSAEKAESIVKGQVDDLQTDKKSETVYIILDSNGKVADERVVNRLWRKDANNSVKSNLDTGIDIKDYGIYSSIQNMEFNVKPNIDGDGVIWPGELLKKGAIYYEGITDKELPVDIKIEYYLDGVRTEAESLAGKDGRLKIAIKVTNKLRVNEMLEYKDYYNKTVTKLDELYVPMMVQMSYAADLSKFSNIQADNAFKVVVGKSMNISYAVFPFPEEYFEFEMDGKNIELDSIVFTMFPQMPPIPDIDMEDQISEMHDGVLKIGDGIAKLKDGSDEIRDGMKKIDKNGEDFVVGINNLSEGSNKLNENIKELLNGFDESINGAEKLKAGADELSSGLKNINEKGNELVSSAQEISSAIYSIKEGTGGISVATSGIVNGIEQLKGMNSQLAQAATMLMSMNKEGSDLYKLGAAILAEKEVLEMLANGSVQIEQGIKEVAKGTEDLNLGIDNQFIPGLQQYNAGIGQLHQGSENLYVGIGEIENGQRGLKIGLESYTNGVGEVNKGITDIKDNVGKLFVGVKDILAGQQELSNGLGKINKDGIKKLSEGVIEGINELRFGEAKKDEMEFLAKNYKSFMNSEKNKNSSVQFLMQTREIKVK